MSDREARMPDLTPLRLDGEELDEGFRLGNIPNILIIKIIMKMQSNQMYTMQFINHHFYDLMQYYPDLCKPTVIANISSADRYRQVFDCEPNTHCLSAILKRPPDTIHIRDAEWYPGECLLQDKGVISDKIIYEQPKTEQLMETSSCRAYFEKILGRVRIVELTLNFDEVAVNPNMMTLMVKYLTRGKQCYDNLTLHLISRNTSLGSFTNLLHAIRPARLKFQGNHCLDIKDVRLSDMRLFIRDNEMGSAEVMSRVATLVEEWLHNGRELDFLYIQFGAGGAMLPPLFVPNGFPLREMAKSDHVIYYHVLKLNRCMHIRIVRNKVWLIVRD